MRKAKKILSALTAAALLLGAAPVSAKTGGLMVVNNWHLDFRDRGKSCSNEKMGWEWDARTKTLTLEDFRIQVPSGELEHQAAVFLPEGSTIELVGDGNEIHAYAYDCTAIYCEGALRFSGRGKLKITTDSRAASGIFVEQGPLVFSGSVELTFDPAGYVFTLNDVQAGETVFSVQDKAKVIFPDDHLRAISVTHQSSVKSKDISYDYDQDIDREEGTVTLLRKGAPSSAGEATEETTCGETPAAPQTSHTYRFTIGSPVIYKDGAAVLNVGAAPYLSSGHVMLPLRVVDVLSPPEPDMAFTTTWDRVNRVASIHCSNPENQYGAAAYFPIGASEMLCMGETVPLSAPAELEGGRAFISLRDLAGALERMGVPGCELEWEPASKTATLTIRDSMPESE